MFVQKTIETCQLAARDVVVAARDVVATIFLLVKATFRLQESIWILLNFLANGRVIAQKVLQGGMGFNEFLIVHEGWILAQLFRYFPMAIQKAVVTGQIAAVDVGLRMLKPVFRAHERVWILGNFLLN